MLSRSLCSWWRRLIDALRSHIDTNLDEGPMRESGLLFPSVRGTIRFTASLQKAFASAARIAGITKQTSARAMRRTFQDITRAADVSSVVGALHQRARHRKLPSSTSSPRADTSRARPRRSVGSHGSHPRKRRSPHEAGFPNVP